MEQLPDLPAITRLSPLVIRILGHNPSKFTLQGTNTYLIGTGSKRILLDTGEGEPEWLDSLKKVLSDEGNIEIDTVLLSHWHWDHTGGFHQVNELAEEARWGGSGDVSVFKCNKHTLGISTDMFNIEDGEVFSTEGATLKAFYTPGHTVDHMCFLLREENALFLGDNVLGHGTAVFEDLAAYMSSLKKMSEIEGFSGRGYPAHGEVIQDGVAKVKEYIAHREGREKEVLDVLGRKREGELEGWTTMEIVKVIYAKYPEHLWIPAEGGVKQVLKKLEGEGRVREVNEGRWVLSGDVGERSTL